MFGQTECNLVLCSNGNVMDLKPGSLGRAVPGHIAGIVDDSGEPLPSGVIGNLAFRAPDPVMMLEYWQDPIATREKFAKGWLITGSTKFYLHHRALGQARPNYNRPLQPNMACPKH